MILKSFYRKKTTKIYFIIFVLIMCALAAIIIGKDKYVEEYNKNYEFSFIYVESSKSLDLSSIDHVIKVEDAIHGIDFESKEESIHGLFYYMPSEKVKNRQETIIPSFFEKSYLPNSSIEEGEYSFVVKDYYDMLWRIENFKNIKLNFNISPILVESVERYINGAHDVHSRLLISDVDALNNEDKNFILQHFFFFFYANMILKRSYYSSLYNKRYSKDNISTDAFSNQEYADIMANFTLCWIDKKFIEIFPNLKYLMDKEENSTIMVIGGDTLIHFVRKMKCRQISLLYELEKGVVYSSMRSNGKTLKVISKSPDS